MMAVAWLMHRFFVGGVFLDKPDKLDCKQFLQTFQMPFLIALRIIKLASAVE